MPAARGAGEVEPARQECDTSLPHGWHGPVGLVIIADSKDLHQQETRNKSGSWESSQVLWCVQTDRLNNTLLKHNISSLNTFFAFSLMKRNHMLKWDLYKLFTLYKNTLWRKTKAISLAIIFSQCAKKTIFLLMALSLNDRFLLMFKFMIYENKSWSHEVQTHNLALSCNYSTLFLINSWFQLHYFHITKTFQHFCSNI